MSSCKKAPNGGKKTLSELVEEYQRDWGDFFQNEAKWWGNQALDWESAQKRAWESLCSNGKMHPHQYRVGAKKLKSYLENVQKKKPESFETFEEVYRWVDSVIHPTDSSKKVNELRKNLLAYDVALRLGMWLKLEPVAVYLHKGAEDGAKNLIEAKGRTAPVNAFPQEIQQLGPTHIENFLCIYKEHLGQL